MSPQLVYVSSTSTCLLNDYMSPYLVYVSLTSMHLSSESRIAQLQKSRESLVSTAGRDMITNAAGFRRPLSTLFHCISCNRPVHLDGHEGYNSMSYRRRGNGNRELVCNAHFWDSSDWLICQSSLSHSLGGESLMGSINAWWHHSMPVTTQLPECTAH